MKRANDFFVGYQARMPRRIARRVLVVVAVIVALVAGMAVALGILQAPLGAGKFEFRDYREFTGIIQAKPYPRLLVERPGQREGHSRFSSWLLVAPFKYGADDLIAPYSGKKVNLQGVLIYRDGQTMLELLPDSIRPLDSGGEFAAEVGEPLGQVTLRGEIVDSKCYLGVMKPGNAKTHRACAVRCISGGVPPILVVSTPAGNRSYYQLIDQAGGSVNKRVLDKVALPVEITGELLRYGDVLVLKAAPESYSLL